MTKTDKTATIGYSLKSDIDHAARMEHLKTYRQDEKTYLMSRLMKDNTKVIMLDRIIKSANIIAFKTDTNNALSSKLDSVQRLFEHAQERSRLLEEANERQKRSIWILSGTIFVLLIASQTSWL